MLAGSQIRLRPDCQKAWSPILRKPSGKRSSVRRTVFQNEKSSISSRLSGSVSVEVPKVSQLLNVPLWMTFRPFGKLISPSCLQLSNA